MKINCGLTSEEKRCIKQNYLRKWHIWFAWFPVRVSPNTCYWLEKVERKGEKHFDYGGNSWWAWEYKKYISTELERENPCL